MLVTLGTKGLKMRAVIQKVREETSLFEVARLYHFDWMNKQWLFQIRELLCHSHFLHCHNASCFNLPLTYFHVRIVFNPPYGKRWRLYIFPQFLSNLTRPKCYFWGEGWAKFVPVITTLPILGFKFIKLFCAFMSNFKVFMR